MGGAWWVGPWNKTTITLANTSCTADRKMVIFVSEVISSSVQALLNNSHLYHLAKDDFAKRGIEGEFR